MSPRDSATASRDRTITTDGITRRSRGPAVGIERPAASSRGGAKATGCATATAGDTTTVTGEGTEMSGIGANATETAADSTKTTTQMILAGTAATRGRTRRTGDIPERRPRATQATSRSAK